MAIAARLRSGGIEVVEAGTAHGALALLDPVPDLVICDVRLPDGSAIEVFQATIELLPEPLKIAISGAASPDEAFRLAQLGVRAYLPKPFTLDQLSETVERVRNEEPEVDTVLRQSVGKIPMRDLQQRIRSVMVDQALALEHGSRSGAARLLNVSRQAVQQIARAGDRNDDDPDSKS